jgi:hypothetical protein
LMFIVASIHSLCGFVCGDFEWTTTKPYCLMG